MQINRLRGRVADRPIDSQVVRAEPGYGESTMDQIDDLQRRGDYVQSVDISRRPTYTKG